MPTARDWACSFRSATVADITLCCNFKCPLRSGCRRAWDGFELQTPFKESWDAFEWRHTESGVTCQFLVPRAEDSK